MKNESKHISDLFASLTNDELKKLYIDEEEIDPGSGRVVNYLFKRFSSFIPAFNNAVNSTDSLDMTRREWAFAIRRSNVRTIEELNHGINNLKAKKPIFLPPVYEFLEMCKPSKESLGIPTVQEAYKEACNNAHPQAEKKWSHAIVFNAALNTGYDKLNNLSLKESYPIFAHNYEVLVNRMMKNEPLGREILVAIPEKIEPPSTKETGKEWLSKIKDRLR